MDDYASFLTKPQNKLESGFSALCNRTKANAEFTCRNGAQRSGGQVKWLAM
ncbi:hypothetical protein MTBBW1_1380043 [Desulfamplus magnetovallimortis]|uniref:Uncharacterized protein n=1 Tax=Desulfamplus magnetovallimortis TaxID=1246637 RepID=A0A1W1H7T2_9BACT|nr:hypothetical protein MTBBW1_1380043 [Desulfamplus magnetovallimortis]